jgi:hypothetical protein
MIVSSFTRRHGCVLPRPRSLALLLLTALGVVAPAAQATVFGLSDQHAGSLLDPRFRALPIDHVRLVVPWDVALTDPVQAGAWLRTAEHLGLVPLVAFEHAAGDACPGMPCSLPSPSEYRVAVAAFRARWPQVSEFTPWNEPNHPAQPTASRPDAAAAMHDALRRDCPDCTVVAGDTVDSASMRGWIRDYRAALTTTPIAWSIHNYGDVTYDRPSYTEWLLGLVDEPVWITETGGIARLGSQGRDLLPFDEQRAATSVRKALRLIAAHPDRIARAYFYQWAAGPADEFDAGLVRPDGTARASLQVVEDALGRRAPAPVRPAAGDPPPVRVGAAGGVAAPAAARPAWPRPGGRRPRRVAGGYRLRVRCRPGAAACGGRVTLTAARRVAARRTLLGARAFRVRSGGSMLVTVRVPRARVPRHRSWRLIATVVALHPPRLSERSWREGGA